MEEPRELTREEIEADANEKELDLLTEQAEYLALTRGVAARRRAPATVAPTGTDALERGQALSLPFGGGDFCVGAHRLNDAVEQQLREQEGAEMVGASGNLPLARRR